MTLWIKSTRYQILYEIRDPVGSFLFDFLQANTYSNKSSSFLIIHFLWLYLIISTAPIIPSDSLRYLCKPKKKTLKTQPYSDEMMTISLLVRTLLLRNNLNDVLSSSKIIFCWNELCPVSDLWCDDNIKLLIALR